MKNKLVVSTRTTYAFFGDSNVQRVKGAVNDDNQRTTVSTH